MGTKISENGLTESSPSASSNIFRARHWNLEIGTMVEMVRAQHSKPPALLFENIPDYPANARLLAGMYNTARRLALTLQLPVETDEKGLVQAWRKKVRSLAQIPPVEVNRGPILENVMTGGAVDLSIFPAPLWHKLDGGRYLGTAGPTITRDPDENWVNLGNYRVMVQGKDLLSVWISPGKHGRIHRDKYFARGGPCPVAIVFGGDPLLLLSGMVALPAKFSEYDFVGAVRGEGIEVVPGPYTKLPIPAHAEMAIEGEILPDQKAKEGPFGEFTGYYASGAHEEYLLQVKTVLYRNDPIICGAPPSIPPTDSTYGSGRLRSALVWNALEDCGVPGVHGVCCHEIGAGMLLTIVSIKQMYPGHAKQAALLATNVAPAVTWDATASWLTTISIRLISSRLFGRSAPAVIPSRRSISCAAAGAARSTRSFPAKKPASTAVSSSKPCAPSNGRTSSRQPWNAIRKWNNGCARGGRKSSNAALTNCLRARNLSLLEYNF